MSMLGNFNLGSSLTFTVTWTPAADSGPPTGSVLVCVHDDKDHLTVGPVSGTATAVENQYKATLSLPEGGRWRVKWVTTPAGGATNDLIYVE